MTLELRSKDFIFFLDLIFVFSIAEFKYHPSPPSFLLPFLLFLFSFLDIIVSTVLSSFPNACPSFFLLLSLGKSFFSSCLRSACETFAVYSGICFFHPLSFFPPAFFSLLHPLFSDRVLFSSSVLIPGRIPGSLPLSFFFLFPISFFFSFFFFFRVAPLPLVCLQSGQKGGLDEKCQLIWWCHACFDWCHSWSTLMPPLFSIDSTFPPVKTPLITD